MLLLMRETSYYSMGLEIDTENAVGQLDCMELCLKREHVDRLVMLRA